MNTPIPNLRTPPQSIAIADDGEFFLSPARQQKIILFFIVIGLVARCARYFLRFPLWEDECYLGVNLMERGYAELLKPLNYHQVCPPLFLWIELTAVKVFGFNELSLRLFPFLCSLVGLLLFVRLAHRTLQGSARLWAVAVFTVTYSGVRYAAEAKQYASDLTVSLMLLTLLVEFWRRPGEMRWLMGLALFTPIAVGLSYPAVFVAGAVSLVLAVILYQAQCDRRRWVWWAVYNGMLFSSFAALYFLSIRVQSGAELSYMNRYWHEAFPPMNAPWEWPMWLIKTHAGDLLAYPVGGKNGGSVLSLVLFLAGIAVLIRRRLWVWLMIVMGPFAVHLTAAILQRYPYGGHFRLSQHLAPLICLLIGLGISAAIRRWRIRRPTWVFVGVLAAIGISSLALDLVRPYKSLSDERDRSFARWFWFNADHEGEVVCLKTDLGLDFRPPARKSADLSASYLCNQRIYSPRHHAGVGPQWDRIADDCPLRCVLFHEGDTAFDRESLERWVTEMQQKYRLVARERWPFARFGKGDRELARTDHLEVFKFVPRGGRKETASGESPMSRVISTSRR